MSGPTVRIAGFELRSRLGTGGMGEVWDALHLEDELPVAIKLVRRDRLTAGAITRFEREVEAMARLDHPGVVGVYDHGTLVEPLAGLPAGSPWLAMERLGGGSLSGRPPADWPAVREVLEALLDALAHTHARGVIHRDLKPGNLLRALPGDAVRPGPEVRIADFGLAVLDDGDGRGGTIAYMAPEQVDPGRGPCGPSTDLYALGCLVWEWVSGAPPFCEGGEERVAHAHLALPPRALSPILPVPPQLEGWLRRTLEKWPAQRFASAAEARWAMRGFGPAEGGGGARRVARALEATIAESAAWDVASARGDAGSPSPDEAPGYSEAGSTTRELPPLPRLSDRSSGWVPRGASAVQEPAGRAAAGLAERGVPALSPGSPPVARPPLPHGAGRALFRWREHPLVAREAEAAWLWERALAAESGRRAVAVVGVPGIGRRRLVRWLRERLAEQGRSVRTVGEGAEDTAAEVAAEASPGPRLLVAEGADPASLLDLVPEGAPVLIVFVGAPDARWPDGVERLELQPLPEDRWTELTSALLPLGPALEIEVQRHALGVPGRAVDRVGVLIARGLEAGPTGFERSEHAQAPDPGPAAAAAEAMARCRTPAERLALSVHAALGADAELVLDDAVRRACAAAGLEPPAGRPWVRPLVELGLVPVGAALPPESAAAILALPGVDLARVHQAAHDAWDACPQNPYRWRGVGEQLLALGRVEAALRPLESGATWFMAADRHREALAVMRTWEAAMARLAAPPSHPRWTFGWCRLSYASWQSGDFAEGERYGRLALEHATAWHPPAERAWPLGNLAQIRVAGYSDLEGAEALLWSMSAEGLAPNESTAFLMARATLRAAQGRHREALEILASVADVPDAHPLRRAEVRMDMVRSLLELGDHENALRRLDEAEAALVGADIAVPPALEVGRAAAELLAGRDERARERAFRALEAARRVGDSVTTVDASVILADALLRLGRATEAIATIRPARATARRVRSKRGVEQLEALEARARVEG